MIRTNVSLTVAIPCFNEAPTVARIVRSVAAQAPLVREIIIVDDGSDADTRRAVDDIANRWSNEIVAFRVIRFEKNRGKGAAVRAAIEAASQPHFLIQDADEELNPACYAVLAEPIAQSRADVVVGDRFGFGVPPELSYLSRLANWIVTSLSNALYGLKLKDQACGYKLLSTALARDLHLRSDGFEICSEMAAKLGKRRAAIVSVPVTYRPRNQSAGKKIRWKDGFISVYTLVKERL